MSELKAAPKGLMQRALDLVEQVGNRVPHPVIIFLVLIGVVVLLSQALYLAGAEVSYEVLEPATHTYVVRDDGSYEETIEPSTHQPVLKTTAARGLLTGDGIRFIYTRIIPNFMGFAAVGLLIVALMGVGVAEEAGLVNALIRTLVIVSPRWSLTYILVFVGILSSVAADAGYLVLIPLAGTAYLSIGRHPIAGIAAGFAAVAGAFTVNMLIKPLDAVLTELTNDAIHMVKPGLSLDLTANVWFSLASVPFLTVIIALISERIIEPRLGTYQGEKPAEGSGALSAEESRGLRYAGLALLGTLLFFGVLTLPPFGPLRDPKTGTLIGDSPFMNGLIAFIALLFLTTGVGYGIGAKTVKGTNDVLASMTKAISGLGGTLLLFVVISQFIAYFNYSNIPTLMAVSMAGILKSAQIGSLALLLGFIIVVAMLDMVFTAAIAKWAIFAPVFVPLFVQLGVDPAAVLAAYRIGDSPPNAISPMNAYFALVVGFAQRYDKNAGIGTVVSLMLPYAAIMLVLWMVLFTVWYLLGLPWGL